VTILILEVEGNVAPTFWDCAAITAICPVVVEMLDTLEPMVTGMMVLTCPGPCRIMVMGSVIEIRLIYFSTDLERLDCKLQNKIYASFLIN
jgi:hypothetical protein